MNEDINQQNSSNMPGATPAHPVGMHAAMSPPMRLSGLAIASMVIGLIAILFGVVAFCLPFIGVVPLPIAIVGLILGIIALSKIRKSERMLSGRGMALTGVITSSVSLVFSIGSIVVGALLLNEMREIRENAPTSQNGRKVYEAIESYASANNGAFPSPRDWRNLVSTRTTLTEGQLERWAMNESLEGLGFSDVANPRMTVLVFEVQSDDPQMGGLDLLESNLPPSLEGQMVVFVNASARSILITELDDLVWDPKGSN